MVFYVLLKFYRLTGGDEHAVLRPFLLGRDLGAIPKTDFSPGHTYCLAVLVVAAICMWRIVHSPFGLSQDDPRQPGQGRASA